MYHLEGVTERKSGAYSIAVQECCSKPPPWSALATQLVIVTCIPKVLTTRREERLLRGIVVI
jgi:hypothetical protein